MSVLRELFLTCCLLWMASGQTEVTVRPEEDAVLECQSPEGGKISVLKWSRPNLDAAGYVFFYRNNRRLDSYQHPAFHGRVQLRTPDMKDGDATLVLKNVTHQDAGTYKCYVSASEPGRSRRTHLETSRFISLSVSGETHQTAEKLELIREEPEGDLEDGVTVGTGSPLVVVVVVVAVVVVFVSLILWTVKRRKRQNNVKTLSEAEKQSMCPTAATEER